MGLGLALVQKVIVTHNGRIAVEPRPGAGARFLITLPLLTEVPASGIWHQASGINYQ